MRSHSSFPRVLILSAILLPAGISGATAHTHTFCSNYAHHQAERISRNTSRGGAGGGALRGAAGGALIGAVAGNAGVGAAVGAGVGAIGGSARRNRHFTDIYWQEYHACMRRHA